MDSRDTRCSSNNTCLAMQQSTRLQRRCYWLLESEDDIVLVHYLNIDKAKGKTEDTWAAPEADISRRPGFTVTSGGIHNIQVSCLQPPQAFSTAITSSFSPGFTF